MPKVFFLSAYMEHLLRRGIRSESRIVGDASRYMRYLLEQAPDTSVDAFVEARAHSPQYARRLRRNVRRFIRYFADEPQK